MAQTAYAKQYRDELIAGFEFSTSLLKNAVTTEFVRSGNEGIFLVVDTGSAEAVTRGANGLIPSRNDDRNQFTATLEEWHDKPRDTRFTNHANQGDGRKFMQKGTLKVLARKTDDLILTELNTATNDTGAAATGGINMVTHAMTILGNNDVDIEEEDKMFGVMSPALNAYFLRDATFTSADYVEIKPLAGPARKFLRWAGINWIRHSRVPGVGTNAEKCFVFHQDAIGFACDMQNASVSAGYNDEEDYYWARCSSFMGAKLLQNSGVAVMNHDGSALVAS